MIEKKRNIFEYILLFSIFSHIFLWDIKIKYYLELNSIILLLSFVYILINFSKIRQIINNKNNIYFFLFIVFLIFLSALTNSIKGYQILISIFIFTFFLLIYMNKIEEKLLILSKIFINLNFFILLINIFSQKISWDIIFSENFVNQTCSILPFFNTTQYHINSAYKIFSESSHFGMVAAGSILCIIINFDKFKRIEYLIYIPIIILTIFFNFSATLVFGIFLTILGILITNFNNLNILQKKNLIFLLLISFSILLINKNCNSRFLRIHAIEIIKYHINIDTLKKEIILDELLVKKNEDLKKYENLNNVTVDVYSSHLDLTFKKLLKQPFKYELGNYNSDKEEKSNLLKKILSKNLISKEGLNLNYNDARSNLLLLLNEIGLYCIFLFITFFLFVISKRINISTKIFACGIFGTQLISGAGYFNGGFLFILILSILLLLRS